MFGGLAIVYCFVLLSPEIIGKSFFLIMNVLVLYFVNELVSGIVSKALLNAIAIRSVLKAGFAAFKAFENCLHRECEEVNVVLAVSEVV